MRNLTGRAAEVPAHRSGSYTITTFFTKICEEIAMTIKISEGLRAGTVCMVADGALHQGARF